VVWDVYESMTDNNINDGMWHSVAIKTNLLKNIKYCTYKFEYLEAMYCESIQEILWSHFHRQTFAEGS
jgi:hypothetical protein